MKDNELTVSTLCDKLLSMLESPGRKIGGVMNSTTRANNFQKELEKALDLLEFYPGADATTKSWNAWIKKKDALLTKHFRDIHI